LLSDVSASNDANQNFSGADEFQPANAPEATGAEFTGQDEDADAIQIAEAQGRLQQRPRAPPAPRPAQPATPPSAAAQTSSPSSQGHAPSNPLTADPKPRGHDYKGWVPPVPQFRKDVFKSPDMQERWQTFNRALGVLPEAGPNETATLRDMYAIEGGDTVGGNGSSSGIHRGVLPNDLRKYENPGGIPTDRRPEVMRGYFDLALRNVGGHAALEQIKDPAAARALASAVYCQGENGGARAVQAAIRQIGTAEEVAKITANPSSRDRRADQPDESIVGPRTLDTYNKIASDPERREALLNALADSRQIEHEKRFGPIGTGGRRTVDLFRPPTP
jgi:hypothetical protein